MPTQHSTTSIAKQGDFSGGASPTGCITPWSPPRFELPDSLPGTENFQVTWPHPAGQTRLTIWPNEPLFNIQRRVVCHFLVDYLPDSGLTELLETLADMHEFYTLEATPPRLLAQHTQQEAAIERTYERPEFRFDED